MKTDKWRYEKGTKTIRTVPGNHWVATMDSWDGAEDHQTNARLIAAAPDMLALLHRVRIEGPESIPIKEIRELLDGLEA